MTDVTLSASVAGYQHRLVRSLGSSVYVSLYTASQKKIPSFWLHLEQALSDFDTFWPKCWLKIRQPNAGLFFRLSLLMLPHYLEIYLSFLTVYDVFAARQCRRSYYVFGLSVRRFCSVIRPFVRSFVRFSFRQDRSCYCDISWVAWAISLKLTENTQYFQLMTCFDSEGQRSKVTAGRQGDEGVHVDARESESVFEFIRHHYLSLEFTR